MKGKFEKTKILSNGTRSLYSLPESTYPITATQVNFLFHGRITFCLKVIWLNIIYEVYKLGITWIEQPPLFRE